MAKTYSCAVCKKRVKPGDRRPITSKALKSKVTAIIVRDINQDDRLCVACRLKLCKSTAQVQARSFVPVQPVEQGRQSILSPQNIQLKVLSTPRNKTRCVVCKSIMKRSVSVGEAAVSQAFLTKGVYINKKSRCCSGHLQRSYFTSAALSSLSSTKNCEFFSRSDIVDLLNGIRSQVNNKGAFNFDIPSSLSDKQYREITGLTMEQFDDLTTFITSLKNNATRSIRTCLAVFLAKLKTGLPNSIIATIFNLNISQIQRIIPAVQACLMKSFVPQHLGFGHIEHNAFVEKHTTPIAKELFTTDNNQAVLILDGTYLYIQKSSDYKFQRQSYSLHKNRPLVKPMMVVASDGYILSVLGPYLADYGNNDANITKHVLNNNLEEIRSWLRKDDVFIVDRGFRDAVEYLEGIGLKVEMPSYLAKGKKQHTTEEANLSRLVTKVRWVVESANGRLKQFRLFDRVMPNTFVPHIGDLVKIVCSILNCYRRPLASMDPETQHVAREMRERSARCNRVQTLVEENNLLAKRSCYQRIDGGDTPELEDFPRLTLDNLRDITMGVYQVKQAASYTKEHMDCEGYEMMICRDLPDLLKVRIQSRHSKNASHTLWVQYSSPSREVRGWYCTCKVGARVVGCCAHVASVLWYLGYKRHTDSDATKDSLSSVFLNADTSSGSFSGNDPLEE